MNRFTVLLLLLIASIMLLVYITPKRSSVQNTTVQENQDPYSVEGRQSKLNEIKKKQQATESLLYKRTAERDDAKSELNQLVRRSSKTSKEIKAQLVKENSELDSQLWFQQIRQTFQKLKTLERDIVIFTRQNENLKKTIVQLEQTIERQLHDDENNGVYVKDEDSELDKMIAQSDVMSNDCELNSLTSAEQLEVDIAVDNLMDETMEKSESKIPNLNLKSIDKLPALPDFASTVQKVQMSDQSLKILCGRVKNDCNKIVENVKKEADENLKDKHPEAACSCWIEALDQLNETVNNAYASEKFSESVFKDYLRSIEECKRETLLLMSKPYMDTLFNCVKNMENQDPDWDAIAESLEGMLRIQPKLSQSDIKSLEDQFEIIRSLLGYLIKQNDWDAKVKSKRLETILDKAEQYVSSELRRCITDAEAAVEQAVAEAVAAPVEESAEKPQADKNNSSKSISVKKSNVKSQNKTIKTKTLTNVKKPAEKPTNKNVVLVRAGDRIVKTVNGVEFAFRWCPSGSYKIGSPESENARGNDRKQREITLNGFWVMETPVTVGMFKAFVNDTQYISKGNTPWGWTGSGWKQNIMYSWLKPGFRQDDNHPVTCVSWYDAIEFCKWLSIKMGCYIYLPTEKQWEYAYRSGSAGAYDGNLDKMAWYNGKSGTHPVGTKQPNAWGLYDMNGNVSEWCVDWCVNGACNGDNDPTTGSCGCFRVVRGCGWNSSADGCRSANYNIYDPGSRNYYLGFRCVICK